ncbi:hypothetical protein BX600DRAFT_430891 [Xylariales sp. PMI_506]|nr:hypothetical protein BX600DRAFT_430891 [Xylariales sp. PMI_506]
MDGKAPPSMADDPAPPPYSFLPLPQDPSSSSSAPTPLSSQLHPGSLTSHLSSHLAAVPDRMKQRQELRSNQQVQSDIWLLDHLLPTVESFLAHLGAQRVIPPLATLTLVPSRAVPPDATLSGIEDMIQRREIGRLVRVDINSRDGGRKEEKSDGVDTSYSIPDSKGAPSKSYAGFTDWGRWEESGSSAVNDSELFWWKDEDLARRLASYLQPAPRPKPPPVIRSPVQAAVEQQIPEEKVKRGWGWGKRRTETPPPPPPVDSPSSYSVAPATDPAGGKGTVAGGDVLGVSDNRRVVERDERAEMSVSAENVAFRRENDFGIWESMSGWAIVVVVKIRS